MPKSSKTPNPTKKAALSRVAKKSFLTKTTRSKYSIIVFLVLLILVVGYFFVRLSHAGVSGATRTTPSSDGSYALIDCSVYPQAPEPNAPQGGIQYLNYGTNVAGINEVTAQFNVTSSMAGTETTYYQFYDGAIALNGSYFGIQTDANNYKVANGYHPEQQQLIFSKFPAKGVAKTYPAEARTFSPGTWSDADLAEAHAISIRKTVNISTNAWHTVTVKRAEEATVSGVGKGDWYDYYYDNERIGGIFFARDPGNPNAPVMYTGGGGTWTENWTNNKPSGVVSPTAEQHFQMRPLKFNNTYGYFTANSHYSNIPQGNTWYEPGTQAYLGQIHFDMGGQVRRCFSPGNINLAATASVVNPGDKATPAPTVAPANPATKATPAPVVATANPATKATPVPAPAATQAPAATSNPAQKPAATPVPAPPAPAAPQCPEQTTGQGNQGGCVTLIQQRLVNLGYDPGAVDGVFGDKTFSAVKVFQNKSGLTVDGIVGPNTWARLFDANAARKS